MQRATASWRRPATQAAEAAQRSVIENELGRSAVEAEKRPAEPARSAHRSHARRRPWRRVTEAHRAASQVAAGGARNASESANGESARWSAS